MRRWPCWFPRSRFSTITMSAPSSAAGRRKFLNQPEAPQTPPLAHRAANGGGGVGMTVTKAVWNQIQSNDHRLMKTRASLARPALVSHSDDRGNARRRRMALVRAGPHPASLWRRAPLRGDWRGRFRGGREHSVCFARSSRRATASGLAKSSRTAGLRFCPRTNIRSLPAIPSRHSASRFRSASSIRNCKLRFWPWRCSSPVRASSWECTF